MRWENLFKPGVLQQPAYTLKAHSYRIKLNQNENPWGFPEAVKKQVIERLAARDWARYPEFGLERLTRLAAAYVDLNPEQVVVGSGSNSLIQALFMVTLGEGTGLIITEPTFTLYRLFGSLLGAEVHTCQLLPESFALPMPSLEQAMNNPGTRLLVLCSPNNPTGNCFDYDQIRYLARTFHGLVVIDEAYHEFSRQDAAKLLREFHNVVILRTFSKAMAMAGLRFGYMLAAEEVCNQVRKARLPYSVNLLAEVAVELCLEHRNLFEEQVSRIVAARDTLYRELQSLRSVRVYPSEANFLLIRCSNASSLFAHLLDHGILVRDVSSYPGLEDCLRVSVGTTDENRELMQALRAWDRQHGTKR